MPKWGLWSECPKNAKVAWGARTIIEEPNTYRKEYNIDLVWDRQSTQGEDSTELQAFCDLLNTDVLAVARKRACELLRDGEMEMHEAKLFTLHDGDVVVLGNTNASCGYLYLIAFRKEDADAA